MSRLNEGMFSSDVTEWETPQWLFDALDNIFQFDIDVAASDLNHKCDAYWTEKDDCFSQSWSMVAPSNDRDHPVCWMNPPYGTPRKLIPAKEFQGSKSLVEVLAEGKSFGGDAKVTGHSDRIPVDVIKHGLSLLLLGHEVGEDGLQDRSDVVRTSDGPNPRHPLIQLARLLRSYATNAERARQMLDGRLMHHLDVYHRTKIGRPLLRATGGTGPTLTDRDATFAIDQASGPSQSRFIHEVIVPAAREFIKWGKEYKTPGIIDFIGKAYEEAHQGAVCVVLIPARTDTVWFHRYAWKASELLFLKGRLKFELDGGRETTTAPFPSAVALFDVHDIYSLAPLEKHGRLIKPGPWLGAGLAAD